MTLIEIISYTYHKQNNCTGYRPLKEQWHPYSPLFFRFSSPHHGFLNILINAIFIKKEAILCRPIELFAFYYPLNVVIHIFPDAVNYFKVLTCMFLLISYFNIY